MNIFECRLLIFPMNEFNTHFTFFAIHPLELTQRFCAACMETWDRNLNHQE